MSLNTTNPSSSPISQYVRVNDLNLHYLSQGNTENPPLLLLHGWPTSSHLWRNLMPKLAESNYVIALDLPGFGLSDKPVDIKYSFDFYSGIIDGFLNAINIGKLGLVVHDLGGPVGLMWAVNNADRLDNLTLLNTLVYPETSLAVKAFLAATYIPGIKQYLTSARGLKGALFLGVHNKSNLNRNNLTPYLTPFTDKSARLALLKTAQGMSPKGLAKVAKELPKSPVPIRLIYGANDKILPDIENTMTQLKAAIPNAELTRLAGCGHFLQEDEPEKVAELISDFINTTKQQADTVATS